MKIVIAMYLYCHRHVPVLMMACACTGVSQRQYTCWTMPIPTNSDANPAFVKPVRLCFSSI